MTYRWTLCKLVPCHHLDVEVFALWLPSRFDQPLKDLWDEPETEGQAVKNRQFQEVKVIKCIRSNFISDRYLHKYLLLFSRIKSEHSLPSFNVEKIFKKNVKPFSCVVKVQRYKEYTKDSSHFWGSKVTLKYLLLSDQRYKTQINAVYSDKT